MSEATRGRATIAGVGAVVAIFILISWQQDDSPNGDGFFPPRRHDPWKWPER
ncbi:MAG: hypothetical protein HYZ28_26175 [Myxococcales bacterium]|nr:hypothetical protein [Myxococcales bacterium]